MLKITTESALVQEIYEIPGMTKPDPVFRPASPGSVAHIAAITAL